MKKLFWIFLTVTLFAAAIFCIGASANGSTTTVGNLTFTEYDTYCAVTKCNTSASGSITIPSSVNFSGTTLPVTQLGNKAFYNCNKVTVVIVPDSVTSIGSYAFYKCSSLNSFTIPYGVTSIGYQTFESCSNLKSVIIPDSVTSIGTYAFENCNSLTSITIPKSVTSIGDRAFYNCSNLAGVYITDIAKWCTINFGDTIYSNPLYYAHNLYLNSTLIKDLVIPNGITSIIRNAFVGCSSLTSVTIPDSVKSIGIYAFENCSNLKNVTIPDSVISIDKYAFYGCSSLTNVTIPYGVTSIGGYTFYNCSSLTNVSIPSSVTLIDEYAFYGCSNFTSVTIPDSVISIGNYAFQSCSGLESVTVPDSVTSIGSYAFGNCVNLTYNEYDNALYLGNINNPYYALIKAKNTSITSVNINEKTKVIANGAFSGCSSLAIVTIPNGIKAISNSMFSACSSLTSITIPDSVTSIGDYAFSGCSGLTNVSMPDSVLSIGQNAFNNCSNLKYKEYNDVLYLGNSNNPYHALIKPKNNTITSLTVNEKTKVISDYAFYQKYSLTDVKIGNGVVAIGRYAFTFCDITSISFGNSIRSIGDYAFLQCSNLESVYITDIAGWCSINFGRNDFNPLYYAHNLYLNNKLVTDLVIPDGVTSIGDYAFYNCNNITSLTVPDSVTSIGDNAFSGCGIQSVYITDLVKWLEISFGDGLSNPLRNGYTHNLYLNKKIITNLVIPDGVTSIGNYAFYKCSSFTNVTIPDGVTVIGSDAFAGCSGLISVTIGDGVTSIGDSAFSGCSSLTNVTIPDSVTSIGGFAFYYCDSLAYCEYDNALYLGNTNNPYHALIKAKDTSIQSITINKNTKVVAGSAFYNCSGLTSVTIPDSITSISERTFESCSSLTRIIIPDGVTSIGYQAFYNCSSLISVSIPDSVTSIGDMAFYNCKALKLVLYSGDQTKWDQISIESSNTPLTNAKIAYGAKVKIIDGIAYAVYDTYSTVICAVEDLSGDVQIKSEIECDGITLPDVSISESAFSSCSGITTITIPDSITSIGESAFYNCGSLVMIVYGGTQDQWSGITIGTGNDVLSGAKMIYGAAKAIVINGIVYCINDSGCTVIGAIPSIAGYIVIPDEIEYNGAAVVVVAIGDNAFSGCTGIVGVTIPADVTSIGEGAFTGCDAIESVYYLGDSTELTVGGGNDNVAQVVVYHTEHTYGEWIIDSEVSSTTVGHRHRVCSVCGHNQGETIIPVLALTDVSLTLQSDLKINFKADKSLFVNIGYEDPYVIFEMNGRQTKVLEYTVVGDKYVFSFKNIAPDKMNDSIKATLYATYAGKEYSSAEITYSVAAYCYDLLNKTTDADAELRTLVVDLLCYGAASQIYSGHNAEEENLANYLLTDVQRAWRTQDEPAFNRVTNANYYNETEQREVSWKSVGLNLNDAITMRFTFTLSDTADTVLRVRNENGQVIYEINSDKFVKEEDGKFTAYYKGLNAADMSKKVFVTLYRGDEAISKTLLYSIESYAAYVKQSNTDENLVSLVTAMMKYGNSAYAYSH